MAWALADTRLTHELELQVGVFLAGLFLACMFCHGELARLKPAPRDLTGFYLMISLGGAAGAAAVRLGAARRVRRWSASWRRSCCRRNSSWRSACAPARCYCCGRRAARR